MPIGCYASKRTSKFVHLKPDLIITISTSRSKLWSGLMWMCLVASSQFFGRFFAYNGFLVLWLGVQHRLSRTFCSEQRTQHPDFGNCHLHQKYQDILFLYLNLPKSTNDNIYNTKCWNCSTWTGSTLCCMVVNRGSTSVQDSSVPRNRIFDAIFRLDPASLPRRRLNHSGGASWLHISDNFKAAHSISLLSLFNWTNLSGHANKTYSVGFHQGWSVVAPILKIRLTLPRLVINKHLYCVVVAIDEIIYHPSSVIPHS